MTVEAGRIFFSACAGLAVMAASTSSLAIPLTEIRGGLEFKFAGVSTQQNLNGGQPPTVGDGYEDSWVVGQVTSITDGLNNLWVSGENDEYLTVMIYGVSDSTIGGNILNGFEIFSSGATNGPGADGLIHIDVWLDQGANQTPASLAMGPQGRTGFGTYPTITDGAPFLRLAAVPGIVSGDSSTTLFQNANAITSPATGDGQFYAQVIGGTAASQFDTDAFTTAIGTLADMFGQFNFNATLPSQESSPFFGCGNNGVSPACWENTLNDPVRGFAVSPLQVPAPTSLGLAGIGLVGLVWRSARRARRV